MSRITARLFRHLSRLPSYGRTRVCQRSLTSLQAPEHQLLLPYHDGQNQRRFSAVPEVKSKKTQLLQQLYTRINAKGPITVAEYMKEVLINPMSGYYMHRDVIGSSGDFITSPEISQMFGELIAVWFLNEWAKAGKPKPFYVIEIGPGRGTMSDDMLRVFSRFGDAMDVISLHLVEVSPHLSQLQELKLCGTVSVLKDMLDTNGTQNQHISLKRGLHSDELAYKQSITKHGVPVSWYHHFEDVPPGFACIIAHEFFDALPIHKFQKTPEGWREVLIDIDDGPGQHHLQYVLSRGPTPASQFFIDPAEQREHIEVSPESGVLIQEMAGRLNRDGGCSLIVDYGHQGEKTDTFRAFRRHALHDPLSEPGTADLTADVDYSFLKKMVKEKALSYGPVTQEAFLKNMHIQARLDNLIKNATSEEQRSQLSSGYDMLINPQKMGERFKFMALFPLDMQEDLLQNPPAGFSTSQS